jgi:hypothetical protein
MSTDLLNWREEDQTVDPEAEYRMLFNGLLRTEGFGLFFAQCLPFGGEKIIQRVRQDLTDQSIAALNLDTPIADGNVFKRIQQFLSDHPGTEVLFIQGLELSLINDEAKNCVSWNEVPPVLINLNQQRERFRDSFQQRLVFLLPGEPMTQLIRQAPDFFDWRSGWLRFD